MKKWYLIIIGIIAIAATAGIIKILSYTSELEKSLSSEHSLNEKNLIILKEWKGVSTKTRTTIIWGIITIILSVLVVGLGNASKE